MESQGDRQEWHSDKKRKSARQIICNQNTKDEYSTEMRHFPPEQSGSDTVQTVREPDGLWRLGSIVTAQGNGVNSPLASHSYAYNAQHERVGAIQGDGLGWSYTYNDKGEVTGGVKNTRQDPLKFYRMRQRSRLYASMPIALWALIS